MSGQPIAEKPEGAFWRGALRLGSGGRVVGLELKSNADGLAECRISLVGEEAETDGRENATREAECCPHLAAAVGQLEEYFRGDRRALEVALAPETGTAFQREVWKACSAIPYGQTRSYWWTAVRAGNPYATRAVGSALGANPLPLFIPCHRVIRSDGALGGFSADPGLKELLLAHEGAEFFSPDEASEAGRFL